MMPAQDSPVEKAMIAACPYAWPWNVLGWPAVNVPAGFTPDGLPLGAQLLGPAGSGQPGTRLTRRAGSLLVAACSPNQQRALDQI